jgi:hypothetical protein
MLFALALPRTAHAQDDDEDEPGGGYFQAGYMELDLDDLNGALVGAGYPALDNSFWTLGGGGYGMKGRFLLGGEGHGLIGSDETTADGARQLGIGGGYGLFRIGYLAYSIEGLEVLPMIGVGGGGMSLSIIERSAPTFDDILLDPLRSARVSTGMFLLDASLMLSYRVPTGEDEEDGDDDEESGGGLLVGLQGGYTFAPGEPSWRLDGLNSVAGGPELKIEGFYIRLSIGGGRRGGEG